MINENLDNKLKQFNTITDNALEILTLIKENYNRIIEELKKQSNYFQYKNSLENINFDFCLTQINNFKEIIRQLTALNNSEEEYSPQFVNLIVNYFVNIDVNQQYSYLSNLTKSHVLEFVDGIKKQPAQYSQTQIMQLSNFLNNKDGYFFDFNNRTIAFEIFNKLKSINNNIVMIGANGSGKSTLSRHLRALYSSNLTVIPSQQLLYYNVPNSISTTKSYLDQLHEYQKQDKLGNSSSIKEQTQDDFTNLILALVEDKKRKAMRAIDGKMNESAPIINDVFDIWKQFIQSKNIMLDEKLEYKINIYDKNKMLYDFNRLSDGEKAILYYCGHVLLASKNSYIVVDEPENHMHTALCDKLWNILEGNRSDCTFVYLTHNLDFAVSRNNKTILWNKSFSPPNQWDFEELPKDELIPERLMIEIVGTPKSLLFCEGKDKSSLDYKLYNILFPNYTVVPMSTRNDVIRSVKAYNANPNLHNKAIGIVDRDNYTSCDENIFTTSTNEVENILCDEKLLTALISHFYCKISIQNFIDEFFKLFAAHTEILALEYVTDFINDKFNSSYIRERKDITKIKDEFDNFYKNIDTEEIYKERLSFLASLISKRDYKEALSNCNLKKALTKGLCNRMVINDYEEKALEYINRNQEIKNMLIAEYFKDIP